MSFSIGAAACWIAHYTLMLRASHIHTYAEAVKIAITRAAQSHVRWAAQSLLMSPGTLNLEIGRRRASMSPLTHDAAWHGFARIELWHTYLKIGRRSTSQDNPANARRRQFLYMNRLKHDSNVIGLCPNQCRENRRTWNKSRHWIFNTPL